MNQLQRGFRQLLAWNWQKLPDSLGLGTKSTFVYPLAWPCSLLVVRFGQLSGYLHIFNSYSPGWAPFELRRLKHVLQDLLTLDLGPSFGLLRVASDDAHALQAALI